MNGIARSKWLTQISTLFVTAVIGNGTMEVLSLARMLVLFYDSKVFAADSDQDTNSISCVLEPFVDTLKTCNSRSYMVPGKAETCLSFFLTLACEAESGTDKRQDDLELSIHRSFQEFLPTFLPYVTKQLFSSHNRSYRDLQLYFKFVKDVATRYPTFRRLMRTFVCDWCCKALAKPCTMTDFSNQYVTVRCFGLATNFLTESSDYDNEMQAYHIPEFLKLCLEGDFLSSIPRDTTSTTFAERKHKENSKLIHSDYVACLWGIVACHLRYLHFGMAEKRSLIRQAVQVQEIASYECLKPIFNCLERILPEFSSTEVAVVIRTLEICWKTVFEMKPCATFWVAVEAFIKMAFQPRLISDDHLMERLNQFSLQLFEKNESCSGLFMPLVKQVTTLWHCPENHSSIPNSMTFLVHALTFGQLHRKDQRIIQDAITYVSSWDLHILTRNVSERYLCADSEVRVRAVILLLALESHHQLDQLLPLLVTNLIEYEKKVTKSKRRHFANSQIHRVKQRVWQVLLLLSPLYTQGLAEKMLDVTFTYLIEESLQPSVRYLMEWLAVRLLLKHEGLLPSLWTAMQKAADIRVGSLGSFLCIIYHLANVIISFAEHGTFIQKAIPAILPWCAAQHFNTRIYAQVALQRLWKLCHDNDAKPIMAKFSILETLFLPSTEHSGTSKGVKKLLEDFNFLVFNHLDHFTIETVFYELPRLSNVLEDEWIRPQLFEKLDTSISSNKYFVPLYNPDNRLSSSQPGAWIPKGYVNQTVQMQSEDKQKDFQRKLTPWKEMLPEFEDMASETVLSKQQNELMVVASLIDRPPNLGGLCRTCEVFGVGQYVVGSLQHVEDKQFQSLSVSAERWVQITEVKPHELQEYLMNTKRHGYTIIGAEQTANSTKLDAYKFPKKSLILLGNEREGIPVELIQLVDVCVEVPQKGVIRSLNVHVTGAIFIWEYTRQHHRSEESV